MYHYIEAGALTSVPTRLGRFAVSYYLGIVNLLPEDNNRKTENDGINCPQNSVDETGYFLVAFHDLVGRKLAHYPQAQQRN